jgi:hypothetical protein
MAHQVLVFDKGDTMNAPLPAILQQAFPNLYHTKQYTRTEWRSECPVCGASGHVGNDAPDRFVMRFDGDKSRAWCRKCGYSVFAVNIIKSGDMPTTTPEQMHAIAEKARIAREQQNKELEARLSQFTTKELWIELNRRMTADNRQWWAARGIHSDWQNFWKLGYRADKQAYSIPYFDSTFHPVTIQYRLTHPPRPNDKYRWEYGLRSAPYITRPDMPMTGPVLICEGAIKAMVAHVTGTLGKMQVMAVPSKSDFADIESILEKFSTVYVCLDPDAKDKARELCRNIGNRARIVDLPGKIDDLILDFGLTPHALRMALKYARPQ